MPTKVSLSVAVLSLLCVTVAAALFVFLRDVSPKDEVTTAKCLRVRTGTVSVEVHYSNTFVSAEGFGGIALFKQGDRDKYQGDALYVLGVQQEWAGTSSVDEIIRVSAKENPPGPQFNKKVLFNGHDAALAQPKTTYSKTWDDYQIPYGNRVIAIDFHPATLSDTELAEAQEMLDGITFSLSSEDAKQPRVEVCSDQTL